MTYLDFSTPKSVMRSIFFEVFISVRGVLMWLEGRIKWEWGFLIVLLGAGERECGTIVERDIIQM